MRRVSKPAKLQAHDPLPHELLDFFRAVRGATRELAAPLSDADATVQSMPDASPAKWHLAHTSWFFEAMLLQRHAPGYRVFDDRYQYLFNSYYEAFGRPSAAAAQGDARRGPRLTKSWPIATMSTPRSNAPARKSCRPTRCPCWSWAATTSSSIRSFS